MKNSKAPAQEEAPKRPLNTYMAYRKEKNEEYKDEENKVKKINDDWKSLDPKVKEKMENEYHESLKEWKVKMEQWVAKNGKLV